MVILAPRLRPGHPYKQVGKIKEKSVQILCKYCNNGAGNKAAFGLTLRILVAKMVRPKRSDLNYIIILYNACQ